MGHLIYKFYNVRFDLPEMPLTFGHLFIFNQIKITRDIQYFTLRGGAFDLRCHEYIRQSNTIDRQSLGIPFRSRYHIKHPHLF